MKTVLTVAFANLLFIATPGWGAFLTKSFDLQPIIVCEPAPFDDLCGESPFFDVGLLKDIYAQLGINVNILPSIEMEFDPHLPNGSLDELNASDALPALRTAIREEFGSGLGNFFLRPFTVYMGFTRELSGGTLGLAYVDSLSSPIGIVEQSDNSARRIAGILAHEIGHNLGGEHDFASSTDLMYPFLSNLYDTDENFLPTFATENATEILASTHLEDYIASSVPEPSSCLLLVIAVLLLSVRHLRVPLSN